MYTHSFPSIQKIVILDQLVLYTVVLSSILLSYVTYRINDGRLFEMEFVKMRFICWSLECLHIHILCDLHSVFKKFQIGEVSGLATIQKRA
jgi:hypothetical protein